MNNIYISTFGKKTIKVKNEIPIEVGSANRNNFLYSVRDDTGINISNENKYYGELTGLYWVWKNQAIQNDELIGFGHYNKTLNVSFKKAYELLVNEKKYNFLIAEKTYITPHAQKDELNAITAILKKYSSAGRGVEVEMIISMLRNKARIQNHLVDYYYKLKEPPYSKKNLVALVACANHLNRTIMNLVYTNQIYDYQKASH